MNQYDEFGLIKLINIPIYAPEYVYDALGDDCAVLPFNEQYAQIITCDLLTEGIHFINGTISARQLGYKAVAASLSDIAAMGGKPTNILISIALPANYPVEQWQDFYDGVKEICAKYQVNLIGGDTTASVAGLTINVTAMGVVEHRHIRRRSAAQVGDMVFVTGALGGSRAGLECLLNPEFTLDGLEREAVLQQHYHPEPCCNEIAVLNALFQDRLHGLNDISDGLLSECHELAQASQVAIVLNEQEVPVHPGSSLDFALTGGEDYQLVGTVAPQLAQQLAAEYQQQTGKPLYFIGSVQQGQGVYFLRQGQLIAAQSRGYNHFTSQAQPVQSTAETTDYHTAYLRTLEEENQRLSQQLEQQSRFRHDLNNHLSCISGLLEINDTPGAKKYLQYVGNLECTQSLHLYSSRNILNVLCNQKAALADHANIDLEIFIDDIDLAFMEDYDICTLIGNMLDNGLENAQLVEEDPYVYFDLKRDMTGNIRLDMLNCCSEAPIIVNQQLVSRKKDKSLHGKGMKNIQQVAEKYGGQFSYDYDAQQKTFHTHILFTKKQ